MYVFISWKFDCLTFVFFQISLSFDFWGRLGLLVNTFATKNVFSGKLRNQKVIIKRLGENSELRHLDRKICKALGYDGNCNLRVGLERMQ